MTLLALGVAGVAAACVPVAPSPPPPPPPPPVVQTCDVHWRGYVLPSDHNYAGIGAYNGSDRYMCKPTPLQGVRAQIQHLRNYADPGSVSTNLGAPFESRPKYDAYGFDHFVYKGAAPRWNDLEGRWAVPGTTYWDTIHNICEGISPDVVPFDLSIMGPNLYSAAQLGARVRAVGNPWKPEISPEALAQIYIDEGIKAGVRGDIAFCQSILETGWFSWPKSPAQALSQQAAGAAAAAEESTTSTTSPSGTAPEGSATTTTSTPGATPELDPVFSVYFELQGSASRY